MRQVHQLENLVGKGIAQWLVDLWTLEAGSRSCAGIQLHAGIHNLDEQAHHPGWAEKVHQVHQRHVTSSATTSYSGGPGACTGSPGSTRVHSRSHRSISCCDRGVAVWRCCSLVAMERGRDAEPFRPMEELAQACKSASALVARQQRLRHQENLHEQTTGGRRSCGRAPSASKRKRMSRGTAKNTPQADRRLVERTSMI
jgi:hypothetical protein